MEYMDSLVKGISLLIDRSLNTLSGLEEDQLIHMVVKNDFGDGRCQGMMDITMLLNGMLKCIENSSLGARSFIFLHSKVKSIFSIPILL